MRRRSFRRESLLVRPLGLIRRALRLGGLAVSWVLRFATATGPEVPVACSGLVSGLRMSMPPLKNAPSSMLMRAAATSPCSDPSARMSTRSVAETLPFTLPSTTTSRAVMLAPTWPLRPIVTRLPGRLIAPSTLPSIYSDSEPVISPLINRPLPRWPVPRFRLLHPGRCFRHVCRRRSCGGSGVGVRDRRSCLAWFPHCAQGGFLFCPLQDWGCQGKANGSNPKSENCARRSSPRPSSAAGNRSINLPAPPGSRVNPIYGNSGFLCKRGT